MLTSTSPSKSPKYQPRKGNKYVIDGNTVETYYYKVHDSKSKLKHKFTPYKKHILNTEHEGQYHPLCKIPGFDYDKYNITVNDIRDGENLIYSYHRGKPFIIKDIKKDSPLFIKLLLSLIVCQYYAVFKRFEYDYFVKKGRIDESHYNGALFNLELLDDNLKLIRMLVTSDHYKQITIDLIKSFGNYLKIKAIYRLFSMNPEKYPHTTEIQSYKSEISLPKVVKKLPI